LGKSSGGGCYSYQSRRHKKLEESKKEEKGQGTVPLVLISKDKVFKKSRVMRWKKRGMTRKEGRPGRKLL